MATDPGPEAPLPASPGAPLPESPGRPPPQDTSDRAVAVLLAVAAVAAAVITLVAVNSSSDASSAWQSSLRQEVARGVSAVEGIRYVYEVEMPGAFQVATEEVRAQELRSAAASAAPELRPRLEVRAQVLEMTVDTLKPSMELAAPAYALAGGGYDTAKRLAEELSDPTRPAYDPDTVMARGDAAAERSAHLMGSIVIIGFAFLFGALAQAFRSARRPFLVVGWIALTLGVATAIVTGSVL